MREWSWECSKYFFNEVDYNSFINGLITLFNNFKFEDSYCLQLREIAQAGSESVGLYAARTTNITSYAFPNFITEVQLDLAVELFVSGMRDTLTRNNLGVARSRINLHKAVQMAIACEL